MKDANLRIRLIRFYQRAGRIKEGFDHALQVSTHRFPHAISVGDPCHFGADPDPHLSLNDPDPTLDPTPFFSVFKNGEIFFSFSYFFLITYPQAHNLQS